jgi:HPt (histidine-containing phosphotransfer) domain-containing protein
MDNAAVSLDRAGALMRLGGDEDIYHLLSQVFLDDAVSQMRALTQAVAEDDAPAALHIAHTLKSSARTVGAMILGGLFADLERRLGFGDASVAKNLLREISAEFTLVVSLIGNAGPAQASS